jgi:hypothetical protein
MKMQIVRPEISKDTILIAALKISRYIRGENEESDAEDIADCYYEHIDGYELAKRLENDCHWDISVDMIEHLDSMEHYVSEEHEIVLKKWVIDSKIEPPFENGTKVKQGVIAGIYEYGAAKFLVKRNGCTDDRSFGIINFEDVISL